MRKLFGLSHDEYEAEKATSTCWMIAIDDMEAQVHAALEERASRRHG